MSTVYIAIGTVDYEVDRVIGVLTSIDEAQERCDSTAPGFDRYRIEEWTIGDTKPTACWRRAVFEPGVEDVESTEWYRDGEDIP
jgi:hypothetical protein